MRSSVVKSFGKLSVKKILVEKTFTDHLLCTIIYPIITCFSYISPITFADQLCVNMYTVCSIMLQSLNYV